MTEFEIRETLAGIQHVFATPFDSLPLVTVSYKDWVRVIVLSERGKALIHEFKNVRFAVLNAFLSAQDRLISPHTPGAGTPSEKQVLVVCERLGPVLTYPERKPNIPGNKPLGTPLNPDGKVTP